MQVKTEQLEPDMKQETGSKLGKEHVKAVYCHPAYLTYMQSTSWETGLDEAQAGIKIVRDFILGGSKITADGDCSHEIKRHLLLGRKAVTNLLLLLLLSRFSHVQLCATP